MPATLLSYLALGRLPRYQSSGTIMDQGPRPDPEYLANSFWLSGRADLWGGYSGGNWFIAPVWRSSEAIWRSGNTFIIRWNLLGDHGGGWTAGKGYDSYATYEEARLSADLYFSRFPEGLPYTLPYKRARFQKSMQALQASFNGLFNTYFNNLLSAPADYPGIEQQAIIEVGDLILAIENEDQNGGGQQTRPTIDKGGWIDGDKLYGFLLYNAKNNAVEVAVYELKRGKEGTKYFVLPWKDNTKSSSVLPIGSLGKYIPGYSYKDITGVFHTHPRSTPPGTADKAFSDKYNLPVYSIGANGTSYLYLGGTTSPIDLSFYFGF